jgi:hypothetical protein
MDFSFPARLVYPAAISLAFPVTLLLVTRVGSLRSHNAAQFLAGALLQMLLWVAGSLLLPDGYRPASLSDWACAGLAVSCALLFYLEVWALLSRGYTLSMLLTLLRAERPLSSEELARKYRGGAGLDWVMQHRVGGLEATGLVRSEREHLALTRPLGTLIAVAYRVAIAVFGLRRTG